MAEYSKQTVAQLRQLLKDRGIPSTGLQRKAQIVERLEEADRELEEAPESSEVPGTSNDVADAPLDPVEQVEQGTGSGGGGGEEDIAAPPSTLEVVEGKYHIAGDVDEYTDPRTEQEVPAVPTAIPHIPHETASHADANLSRSDHIQAIEQPADGPATEKESSMVHPVTISNTPPTDVEAPYDKATNDTKEGQDALPDASVLAMETQQVTPTRRVDQVSSPAPNEKLSVEKPELLPIPERSTADTSRLNTEELEADSRKRKRRSATPELPAHDIRAKKLRPGQDFAPDVHLQEDVDAPMEERSLEQGDVKDSNKPKTPRDTPKEPTSSTLESGTKRAKKENVSRYKNLVEPTLDETPMDAITDDRPSVPAIHPVTAALYIRNFMRPLRPELLRAHLVSLATPPSSSPDPSVVKILFLDSMKTHALVSFTTTNAASRVRVSLHGSIWPPEGNRKELWADFIPEDRVDDWIKQEEDAIAAEKEARANGRSMLPKRYEIVYEESSDGVMNAVFQEVGGGAPFNAPRGPRASIDVRHPSLQQTAAPHGPTPFTDSRQDIEASFKTLDELFYSTKAKPQLFYLPVSDDISDTRLKELSIETSRDWTPGEVRKGRGIKVEMRYKYSFDNEDRIVEVGEDRGPWSEGYRGGRGGFRGRARGGGFVRGRGGDSWRG